MKMEICILNSKNVAVIAIILSIISLLFVWMALIRAFKGEYKKLVGEKIFIERFFLLIIVLLVQTVIVVVAFCIGVYITHITYGQTENIWDIISTIATCIGVIASFAAVWVAIQIPNKIAKQQEKRELYMQRLDFYNVLDACIRFSKDAENQSSQQMINYMFLIKVGFGELPESKTYKEIVKRAMPLFHRVITSLRAGEFLFDFEVQKYVQKIIDTLPDLLNAKDLGTIRDCFLKYQDAVNEAQINLIPKVKDSLKLWSNK